MREDEVRARQRIAQENREIVRANCYEKAGQCIELPGSLQDHQEAQIFDHKALREAASAAETAKKSGHEGTVRLLNADSLAVPTDLVLNFANAFHPGGGYLGGAMAQEECLCRQSTLYASLDSQIAANEYYDENKASWPVGTNRIMYSPHVAVFRSANNSLLDEPHSTTVLTAAALNRMEVPKMVDRQIEEVMRERILHVLRVAAAVGAKSITLGAWGCGAFHLNPQMISRLFREALVDEGFRRCFELIIFAIYASDQSDTNYNAFRKAFEGLVME